jgi:TonB family protein
VRDHKISCGWRGRCLAMILVGALTFAHGAGALPWGDANPGSDASSSDSEAPRNGVHFSAQTFQAMYLKGQMALMKEAEGSAKEVTCLLSLWYAGDGGIQAVQLLKGSGSVSMDQACLQAVIGRRLEGLPDGGPGGRTLFTIYWVLHPKPGDLSSKAKIELDPSIPQLPAEGGMHPLPQYPAEALAERAHGICKMHITVSAVGAVSGIEVTQSTGSKALDSACKQAVTGSSFVPAVVEGQPASSTTDVAIVWRLPRE